MFKKNIFIFLVSFLLLSCGGGFEGVEIGNPATKVQGQIVMVPDAGEWFYQINFVSFDTAALQRVKKAGNVVPALPYKENLVVGDRAFVPYTLNDQGVVNLGVEFADQVSMTMQFQLNQEFEASLQDLQINSEVSTADFSYSFKNAQSAVAGQYQLISNDCQNDGQSLEITLGGGNGGITQLNFSGGFEYQNPATYSGGLDAKNYISFIIEGANQSATCYATVVENYFSGACKVTDLQNQNVADEICFFAYEK